MNNYILTKDGNFYSIDNNGDNELYHYGVLGMKWGIHRASKKGTTYTYKSHGQRKWDKKLDKAIKKGSEQKKIDKATKKVSMYKERDKSRQSYAESTTVGKSIAKQLLLGPVGSGAYSRLRASGMGRASSAVVAYFGSPIELILSKAVENASARNRLNK